MTHHELDVLILSDFRYPGGNSAAIAEEVKAAAKAGYRVGLLHIAGANVVQPLSISPRITNVIDAGYASILSPSDRITTRLAAIHNPYVVQYLPCRPLRIQAEHRLLVVHHPPFSPRGEAYYDLDAVATNANLILGGPTPWAPVGPKVREQLRRHPPGPHLWSTDWHNVLDPDVWHVPRTRFSHQRPVIGRHSRPALQKWPDDRDTILKVYPNDPRFVVRILGGFDELSHLVGGYPTNWEVSPFDSLDPHTFLKQIDFFVYFHHSNWIEAFGCNVLEAMASGAVAVLPHTYEDVFCEGALYASPEDVFDLVLDLHADFSSFDEQSTRAVESVRDRFTHSTYQARLESLIGPPVVTRTPKAHSRRTGSCRRVLLLSSNGVGMGHLARNIAIARRLSNDIRPVIATMSQGLHLATTMGFLAEYIPFHAYLESDPKAWNYHLRSHINELCRFYRIDLVVFDGNCPYSGLGGSIFDNPKIGFIWCRRGMWRAAVGEQFMEREHWFDAVIEPNDYASSFDCGLTKQRGPCVKVVNPMTMLDFDEALPRDHARRELGIYSDRLVIALLLGAGNNFDINMPLALAIDVLASYDNVELVFGEWLISNSRYSFPEEVKSIQGLPLARYIHAYDGAIATAGYNTFHELLRHGIPSVFIPNENPRQDDQLSRARWAEMAGKGLCARSDDPFAIKAAIERLLDPDERAFIGGRCATLDRSNGAYEAARLITEMAYMVRADRPRG